MFVCTLPSPACMCSAIHTRPRSTRLWISSTAAAPARTHRRRTGAADARALPSSTTCGSSGPARDRTHARAGSRSSATLEVARAAARTRATRAAAMRSLSGVVEVLDADTSSARESSASNCRAWLCRSPSSSCARAALELRIVDLAELQLAGEVRLQLVEQLQLVPERQLDVDALDRVRVVAHALERDHDVFVDLERVRVLRDRRRARAIEPELLARIGVDGDEALARATVGDAHDFRGRARHRGFVVADDVAEQHHLRQRAALRFGRVADRAQVALVEVLETGELHAARRASFVEERLDLDDRRNRMARVAEELQAHRADVLRHAMQEPARRRDDAVAAFLLHARQTAEKLVGHVLAETDLAELAAFDLDARALRSTRARSRRLASVLPHEVEAARRRLRESCRGCARRASPRASCPRDRPCATTARLSTAVPHSTAFLPPAFIATLPPMHEASAEVGSTANTQPGTLRRRRETRRVTTPASLKIVARWLGHLRQRDRLHRAERFQLLGVDHCGKRRERNGAAGVARCRRRAE